MCSPKAWAKYWNQRVLKGQRSRGKGRREGEEHRGKDKDDEKASREEIPENGEESYICTKEEKAGDRRGL